MKQAIILAGGSGTRLSDRLGGRPKALATIEGKPLLGWQFALLRRHSFERVLLLVHHGREAIEAFCKTDHARGLSIEFVDDGQPQGTAGALLAAFDRLDESFLVLYGDTILNVDLTRFWEAHARTQADVTLFLHPNDHPGDSDLVELHEEGWVKAIHPYPHPPDSLYPNLVNAALYALDRRALEPWKDFRTPSDLAKDLFPAMAAAGHRLRGYISFEYIKDIGTPERLDAAVRDVRSGRFTRGNLSEPQVAVFADRDGTINVQRDYVRRPEELVVYDGVGTAVRRLNEADYRVVVVSNQPVIARGECTPYELRQIHSKMEMELARQGAYVDRIYFCPHHPEKGFAGEVKELKIRCSCRKPEIGMIDAATAEMNIDRRRSWLIGDTTTDMLTAERAGLRSILLRTGAAGQDGKFDRPGNFTADNLSCAVSFILDVYPKMVAAARSVIGAAQAGDVILIGGLAKLGKSTFAQMLEAELVGAGHEVRLLCLDRWIRNVENRGAGVLERFNLGGAIEAIAPWLVDLQDIDLVLPRYDRLTRRREATTDKMRLSTDAVLIIEGVPALWLDLPGRRRTWRIYVEGLECIRRDRVIADLMARNRSPADANATYADRCADETPFVEKMRTRADLIINLDGAFSSAHLQ